MNLMEILQTVGAALTLLLLGFIAGRESIMRHALGLLEAREETPPEVREETTLEKRRGAAGSSSISIGGHVGPTSEDPREPTPDYNAEEGRFDHVEEAGG